MKNLYISILLVLGVFLTTHAQESFFSANFTPSIPLDQTNSFINDASWRSVSFEHRHYINAMFTVGANFGWTVYNKQLSDYTQNFETAVLYGNQYRIINVYPLLGTLYYHLWPEKYFRPYFGGGIGVFYVHKTTEMGLYSLTNRSWNFGLAPEVGVLYDFSPEINFLAGISYSHGFKTSESDHYSALNFKIGIVWVRL
jgi:opacity protein-like surface antigen